MANWRVDMIQIRQIIKLMSEGKSQRKTEKLVGVSRDRVKHYFTQFLESGLTLEEIQQLSDEDLFDLFNEGLNSEKIRMDRVLKVFPKMETELKKTGVTKELLWAEYNASEKQSGHSPYSYSRFCHHFSQWKLKDKVSMRLEHKAGDKLYVDFTGDKFEVIDSRTGDKKQLECFVAILPASQYIYVEVTESQKVEDFVAAVENTLHFIGGSPEVIVPDNLKSAVTKAHKYESIINRNFRYFAEHYDTHISPARPQSPKDKAHVENAVKIVYRRVFAEIRNETFSSIEKYNQRIQEKLSELNNRKLTGRGNVRVIVFCKIAKISIDD